jgi:nicotinate-nucleotide adenylyltransferase
LSSFSGPPYDEAAVRVLDMAAVDLSSSFVRERVARGETIESWVPRGVAAYVRSRGLYRAGGSERARSE